MLAEHIGSKARSRPRWSPDAMSGLSDMFPLHDVKHPPATLTAASELLIDSGHVPASAAAAPGGARRDRTDDLMLAKHALSQLSYGPIWAVPKGTRTARWMVGLGRLERPTSPLSGVRSNHLSYRPKNVFPRTP